MRSTNLRSLLGPSSVGLVAALSLVATCDWREFSDIADTTWVASTGAPSGVGSNDFAVGLAEANNEATNETKQLAVISRSKLTLAFLAYDAAGKLTNRQTLSLDSNSGGPFESLAQAPVYASDPKSGRVAVSSNGKVAIGDPNKATLDVAILPNSAKSAGLTFLEIGGKTYVAAASERGVAMIDLAAPTVTTSICTAPMAISRIIALGTAHASGGDQLVIWYENSPMARTEQQAHTVTVAAGACTLAAVGAGVTSQVLPTRAEYPLVEGARILSVPDSDSVVISDPLANTVSITRFAVAVTSTMVQVPDIAAVAVGKLGADAYVFAGSPNQDIDGTINAGRVQAIKITPSIGLENTPAMSLFDASPDSEQRFGRAVALVPFTDANTPIVVVGADNEMFTYFRSQLYGERRAK
jgi:hypothetical protein